MIKHHNTNSKSSTVQSQDITPHASRDTLVASTLFIPLSTNGGNYDQGNGSSIVSNPTRFQMRMHLQNKLENCA